MTGLDCNVLVQLALADHPTDFAVFGVLETIVP